MHRVLVVDDHRALRRLIAHALELQRYAVVEAESGEDALVLAAQDPPAVAVVDYHLPAMSGATLVRFLRASPDARLRDLPVVGLSGRAGSERALLDAGASCFVRKPFHEADLLRAVRWAIAVYVEREDAVG